MFSLTRGLCQEMLSFLSTFSLKHSLPSIISSTPTWDVEFLPSAQDELSNRASSTSPLPAEESSEPSSVTDVSNDTFISQQGPVVADSVPSDVSLRKSSRQTRKQHGWQIMLVTLQWLLHMFMLIVLVLSQLLSNLNSGFSLC